MLIEIIISLLSGILAGTFTGLFPGIHINLVGTILVSLSAGILASVNPVFLAVFIVSMAIAHTFLDFIPSVFLGCPDTDTSLSVLPGHELLKDGKGCEAVALTAYGGLMAIFMIFLIAIPAFFGMEPLYEILKIPYVMASILIIVSLILIFSDKKKFYSLLVFALAGILGLIILNMKALNQPLLPLLSGLFGASSLILSIKNKVRIPSQEISFPKVKDNMKGLRKAFFGTLIASPLCAFLPGLGSGEAAVIGNQISRTDREGFLILIGATNTLVMGLSFISLYLISKSRTGAAAAVNEILGQFSFKFLILFLIIILISGLISFLLTLFLARFFSGKITKINYQKISVITLVILSIIVTSVSGFLGLFALIVSTLAGLYCISLGVKRTTMMACLLLPTIIIYLT
ncbi:MAG: tripartite tricarboxylate transporter permease [Candidatus Nanoarchaeia archaeon]|nr:tripartite tricarboxylate transporter permease [Candidatus Nanoarchaeia archaeon]